MNDHVLTKRDLQALRAADSVSFYVTDRSASIVCTKRVRNPGPFDDSDKRYSIGPVDYAIHAYSGDGASGNVDATCFAWVSTAQMDPEWRTVVASLRVSDAVSLAWVANNDSEVTRNAGLHSDFVRLVARRLTRSGKGREYHWRVDSQTGPNNSARMIRDIREKQYASAAG